MNDIHAIIHLCFSISYLGIENFNFSSLLRKLDSPLSSIFLVELYVNYESCYFIYIINRTFII